MTLHEYLERNRVKFTAAEFATRIDVSEATVTRIRQGKQNISRELIARIVAATGGKVTPEALVFPQGRAAA